MCVGMWGLGLESLCMKLRLISLVQFPLETSLRKKNRMLFWYVKAIFMKIIYNIQYYIRKGDLWGR